MLDFRDLTGPELAAVVNDNQVEAGQGLRFE